MNPDPAPPQSSSPQPPKSYNSIGAGVTLTLILHIVFQTGIFLFALASGAKDAPVSLAMFGLTQFPYMFAAAIIAVVTARLRMAVGLIIGGAVSFLIGFVTCVAALTNTPFR